MKLRPTLILIIFCIASKSFAQSVVQKNNFEGIWYNKENKRELNIKFDEECDCFIINDKSKGYSEDVYNAYPKDDKLVMPVQNEDHHSSYCEIKIEKKQLIYECNSGLNFTDNFLNRKEFSSKLVFVKRTK